MKKVIYSVGLVAVAAMASCSGAIDSLFKANFVKECNAASASMDEKGKASFDKYCNCAADKVLAGMSKEELKEIEKNPTAMSPEIEAKFMNVIKPCLDDLEKEMGAAQ